MTRETASQRCPRCRTSFRTLADEVGDHECPRCGLAPGDEDEPDDTAAPRWDKAEEERSLTEWLERRVNSASCVGSIRVWIAQFERMWAEEFGPTAPIPLDLKDRVNQRIKAIREAVV